jgi:hypothetical protein
MNPTTINGSEIVGQYGEQAVDIKLLTPLQKAGLRILLGVAIVSVFVIIGLGLQWISQAPKFPNLPISAADTQQIANTKMLLENYKAAGELALSGPKELLDMIVLKMLYPLFTLVLGYVFGTRRADTDRT